MNGVSGMSYAAFKTRGTGLVLAAATVALLAGCAKRDSITVGAVPDDYQKNGSLLNPTIEYGNCAKPGVRGT